MGDALRRHPRRYVALVDLRSGTSGSDLAWSPAGPARALACRTGALHRLDLGLGLAGQL